MNLLKGLFFFVFRYSGISTLLRWILARKKVTVLVYHNPSSEQFFAHMNYCNKRYTFITFSRLIQTIQSGDWADMPKYPLVVTLDDGWKGNFKLVDTFSEFSIRPMIFITSGIVGTSRKFWWTVCQKEDVEQYKSMSNSERLLCLKENYGYDTEREYEGERQALDIPDLEAMKSHVEFGSHTEYHPILNRCTEEEIKQEISKGKSHLENILNIEVNHFAYPNGDYKQSILEQVNKCGIQGARTLDVGWVSRRSNPHIMRSMYISDDGSLDKLSCELVGIPQFLVGLAEGNLRMIKYRL